jgi:hypothetical protein
LAQKSLSSDFDASDKHHDRADERPLLQQQISRQCDHLGFSAHGGDQNRIHVGLPLCDVDGWKSLLPGRPVN